MNVEGREPGIDAVADASLHRQDRLVEAVGRHAGKPGRSPVAILLHADDDVAAVSVREGCHVGKELADLGHPAARQVALEVQPPPLRLAAPDQLQQVGLDHVGERSLDFVVPRF